MGEIGHIAFAACAERKREAEQDHKPKGDGCARPFSQAARQ